MALWAYLWEIILIMLFDVRGSILIVGRTISWAGNPGLHIAEKANRILACMHSLHSDCGPTVSSCFDLLLPWPPHSDGLYVELWAKISLKLFLSMYFITATGEEPETVCVCTAPHPFIFTYIQVNVHFLHCCLKGFWKPLASKPLHKPCWKRLPVCIIITIWIHVVLGTFIFIWWSSKIKFCLQ